MAYYEHEHGVGEERLQEAPANQIRRGLLDPDVGPRIPARAPFREQSITALVGHQIRGFGEVGFWIKAEPSGTAVCRGRRVHRLQVLPLVFPDARVPKSASAWMLCEAAVDERCATAMQPAHEHQPLTGRRQRRLVQWSRLLAAAAHLRAWRWRRRPRARTPRPSARS